MKNESSFGFRNWLSVILIGFIGQVAWAIENNYINLWVYSQTHNTDYINWMTVASAVVATLTTFFTGALSDRLGKRKVFIAGGYCIWGLTVFLFGVMSLSNMTALAGISNALFMVGLMNTLVDCLMTFFGSTSNDACYNAYVTDITNSKNRGKVETVISVLPLFATAAMLGVGLIVGVPGSQGSLDNTSFANAIASKWFVFFLIFGVLTTLVGIASFFLLPKEELTPNKAPYLSNLVHGFKISSIKAHPLFYISLLAFMFFNIAIDAFMPYYMVYFTNKLASFFYPAVAIIIGVASLSVLLIGAFMEKIGKMKLLLPSLGLVILGALLLFLQGKCGWAEAILILGGTILMAGYLIGTAVLGANLRDETPEKEVGLFQGVRMVFAVMLPMVIGSNISNALFQVDLSNHDASEIVEKVPNEWMFLVALIAGIIAILPVIFLLIENKKKQKNLK